MLGRDMLSLVRDFLGMPDRDFTLLTRRRIFDAIDEMAVMFCRESRCLRREVSIALVQHQRDYSLPTDFIAPALRNTARQMICRIDDVDGNVTWARAITAAQMARLEEDVSEGLPSCFTLRDPSVQPAAVLGAADSATNVGGVVTITIAGEDLSAVQPRDPVHNVTTGATGLALSQGTEAGTVSAAFFPDGYENIAADDAVSIYPADRFILRIDTDVDEDDAVLTLPYFALPRPVYGDFLHLDLPAHQCRQVAAGAAWRLSATVPNGSSLGKNALALFDQGIKQARTDAARAVLQGNAIGGARP